MASTGSFEERRQLAAAYVAGVRALLTPAETRDGPLVAELDKQADSLLPASQALKAAAEVGLIAGTTPLERAAAEVQLLAGVALDLAVAGRLAAVAAPAARGLAAEPIDVSELQALIEAPEAYLAGAVAGRGARTVSDSRAGMATAVNVALASIRDDVVSTGTHAVEGLLLMDAALLKEALLIVGSDLADRLGIDLAGVGRRVVDFVIAANDKLIALLGLDALDEARRQLAAWLEELRAGTLFPDLVEKVFQTATIGAEVGDWIAGYQGEEAVLLMGREEINQLAGRFAAKANVADKITSALAVIKLAPPLITPVGRLATAAAYLGLLAYLVGSGYDHVDSDRIRLLDWVEGVRGVSKRLLTTPVPAHI